jgi:hypothetical protein
MLPKVYHFSISQFEEDDSISIYEGLFADRKFPEDGKPIYIETLSKNVYSE